MFYVIYRDIYYCQLKQPLRAITMYSPPSPPTPPTPDWEAIREAQRRAEEERQKKEAYIKLVLIGLKDLPQHEGLVTFFSNLLDSNMYINKRYDIAQAINTVIDKYNLKNQIVQSIVIAQFKKDIFNQESALYQALNYQRNGPLAITFFGSMSYVSCNYARSLQTVQAMILQENQDTSANNQHCIEL